MSSEKLRVGVVGLGWAGEQHVKGYIAQPDSEMVALADANEAHLAELKLKYDVPYTYTDYETMLEQCELDAISIATPNYLHAPIAIAALENGLHVLTEKPIARDAASAKRMVETALEQNRVLEVVFNQRQSNDVRVVKKFIDEGRLGRIYHAKASWMRRQGIPGFGGWFTSRELAGGGPLIDLGIHVLDMALYLMGEPEVEAVSAMTYSELGHRGLGNRRGIVEEGHYDVEDLATSFIRLKDGATLLLEASWAAYARHGDDFGVELFGTDGGAQIEILRYNRNNSVKFYVDAGGVPAVVKPEVSGSDDHAGVVRDFLDAIQSGKWSDHVGRQGLRRAQIIEACYLSADEGREIQLVDLAASI